MKAEVHIQAAGRNGETYLRKSFSTQPFKVADITEGGRGSTLRLVLMSSSPGILDEDAYKINIELSEAGSLELLTQSYQRLFTMKKSASQVMEVQLSGGSSLIYLPHPAVPHRGSRFEARNRIHLSQGCRLVWGEVLTCGRKLNGEIFAFSAYHSVTEIFVNGKLVMKENLLLEPEGIDVRRLGQMEEFTHQATLMYVAAGAIPNGLVDELRDCFSKQERIAFGVSLAPVPGIVVRLLGQKGEQLFDCIKMAAKMVARC